MIEDILKIPQLIKNNEISFSKHGFIKVFEDYSFFAHTKNISIKEEEKQKIIQNIKESQLIIFSQSDRLKEGTENKYLILGFEKTLIILDQSATSISFLFKLVSINSEISVCFLSNTNNFVKEKIEIHNQEIEADEIFQEEIINFKNNCSIISNQTMIKIYSIICPSILGYLIKKSYYKTKRYRIEKLIQDIENNHTPETINENEYAELRIVGIGNLFICILIYHIQKGELYVIKKPKSKNPENTKLIKRESKNYSKIMHPFLPKFIGRIKDKDYIVIEYIKGQTLEKIAELELTFDDLTTIIFELLVIIKYFHDKGLICRDIKPNNIMIDEQKTVVMIDFDRLIESGKENDNFEHTLDLNTDTYMAPEIFDGEVTKYSFKSDIYSLGKVVEYLINQTESYHDPMKIKYQTEYSRIKQIFIKCIDKTDKNRPSISDLMNDFISKFQKEIFIEGLCSNYKMHFNNLNIFSKTFQNYKANQPEEQIILGTIYFEGQYVTQNINKAIHYYSLAANQNHPDAQFILGVIYDEGQYVTQNINKAIHYYSLAANQNHPDAQFNLGTIYYEGQYVTQNIDKAIHYYSLAANQNHPYAQFFLGVIYYNGRFVTQNINKAIHYFSLAANQNHPYIQFFLGVIYDKGQYVTQNIDKAIHYLSLAANQNLPQAQFILGVIYDEGQYVTQNINKAIHYYSLAANQNHPYAQLFIGLYYITCVNSVSNIKKGTYYIMLASINGERTANFIHGFLLHEGKNVKRDIEKAIHYYKEASSFNIHYAKNNLGIIFKHGFSDKINKCIGNAIVYFEEAIRQKNDFLSMYNLAHLYMYDKTIEEDINKSIELLIKSSDHFQLSKNLLCILLVKQFGFNIDTIKGKIEERTGEQKSFSNQIIELICDLCLFDKLTFEIMYESYRKKDFLYSSTFKIIKSSDLLKPKEKDIIHKYRNAKDISSLFYEGFGEDL
ncbi:hypothetical protein M9Y10_016708 [Tritrichomonas musculus]|uniref:Protein kinase domain-containing protein n=1 Tax=Tritrichomonas musculus TaxID=1915356 RepID=A0ABR2HXB4_9EUKA